MSDRNYVYLVEPSRDPALMGWQAALAGRDSARANVVLIGPATVEGYPTTNFDRTTAEQLARILRARFPTSGIGINGGRGRVGIPSQGLSPSLPSPLTITGGVYDPVAYDGTPAHHYGASHTSWTGSVSADKIQFELDEGETSFDIIHVLTPYGHASGGYYKINGNASITFNTYAATPQIATTSVAIPSTEFLIDDPILDAFGVAELEVGCSGSGQLTISEFILYAGDETCGIAVHGVGHAGYDSSDMGVAPTTAAGWRSAIANLDPDVIILECGMNDAIASSASAFGTNLLALVTTIRAFGGPIPTVPILLAAPYDASGGEIFVDPWPNYVAQMRLIANIDPYIAFVNEGERMPGTDELATFGLYHTDKIHSNANGKAYALQAHILADALSL